jgi:uncharacterized protein (TIGR00106 family)
MSVIVELSIFPMDKGQSVGSYVARAVGIIDSSGVAYTMGPMGTSMEGEWDEIMGVVTRCFNELRQDCERVYMVIKVDYRRGAPGRLDAKVASVEEKLGGEA